MGALSDQFKQHEQKFDNLGKKFDIKFHERFDNFERKLDAKFHQQLEQFGNIFIYSNSPST